MHLSPNVLAAVWSSPGSKRETRRGAARDTGAAPTDDRQAGSGNSRRTRPDYGCVEWYFYEERVERREGA